MRIKGYFAVWRPDHWFKNVFMLAGTMAALLLPGEQPAADLALLLRTLEALAICCLAASANYIVNEILDAERDALHPTKRLRPIPSGAASVPALWATVPVLVVTVLTWSWLRFGGPFAFSVGALLSQGFFYNVPPIRTKEVAYLDVVSEAINNPIRLMIGWYAAGRFGLPPMSLFFGYWVFGGFLMTAKRYAEYRFIGDPEKAAAYRSSFRTYSEESLLIAMISYAGLAMFFYGVLLVRYQQFDLFLSVPFVTAFLAWFFHLAFRPDSIVKEPERLYQAPGFAIFSLVVFGVIIGLAVVDLDFIWTWVNDLQIGVPLRSPS